MFRASSCPSSGATTTAVAASSLPLVIAVLLVVVRAVVTTGPTTTNSTALHLGHMLRALMTKKKKEVKTILFSNQHYITSTTKNSIL
jgi:hypothetical protein